MVREVIPRMRIELILPVDLYFPKGTEIEAFVQRADYSETGIKQYWVQLLNAPKLGFQFVNNMRLSGKILKIIGRVLSSEIARTSDLPDIRYTTYITIEVDESLDEEPSYPKSRISYGDSD